MTEVDGGRRAMRGDAWILLGILLLALVVRLPNLDESLWFDEAYYSSVLLRSDYLQTILTEDVHPPFYPLIILGWTELVGEGEVRLRLPSLFFGLASMALAFLLARDLFGRRTACLTGLLLALSPLHVWYSQENRDNMMALYFTVLAMYALRVAWRRNGTRWWLLFALSAALCTWAHLFAVFINVAAFAWMGLQLTTSSGRTRMRGVMLSAFLVVLSALPLVFNILGRVGSLARPYLRTFSPGEVYKLLLIYLPHGNTLHSIWPYARLPTIMAAPTWSMAFDAFYAALLVGALIAVIRTGRGRTGASSSFLFCYLFVPIACALGLSLVIPKSYVDRNLMILLPPYMMALAVGLNAIPLHRWRIATTALVFVLSMTGLANMWVFKADATTVNKPNPDWDTAAAYFDAEMDEGQERVPVFGSTYALALRYYEPRAVELSLDTMPAKDYERLCFYRFTKKNTEDEMMRTLAMHGASSFYVIRNAYWLWSFDHLQAVVDTLDGFEQTDRFDCKGLTITRYGRAELD